VLIAPAVDFTEELMWKRFSPEIRREIEETGSGRARLPIPQSPTLLPAA